MCFIIVYDWLPGPESENCYYSECPVTSIPDDLSLVVLLGLGLWCHLFVLVWDSFINLHPPLCFLSSICFFLGGVTSIFIAHATVCWTQQTWWRTLPFKSLTPSIYINVISLFYELSFIPLYHLWGKVETPHYFWSNIIL